MIELSMMLNVATLYRDVSHVSAASGKRSTERPHGSPFNCQCNGLDCVLIGLVIVIVIVIVI
jgi:hypothetical protein